MGAVTFVQAYILTVGLLSWKQAYNFFSPIPLFSNSFPLPLCTDESDMRIILFCHCQCTSHIAFYFDVFNLNLIEYYVAFLLLWSQNISGRNIYGILTLLAILLIYQKQGSAEISEPFKFVLVIAFKIQH